MKAKSSYISIDTFMDNERHSRFLNDLSDVLHC